MVNHWQEIAPVFQWQSCKKLCLVKDQFVDIIIKELLAYNEKVVYWLASDIHQHDGHDGVCSTPYVLYVVPGLKYIYIYHDFNNNDV